MVLRTNSLCEHFIVNKQSTVHGTELILVFSICLFNIVDFI